MQNGFTGEKGDRVERATLRQVETSESGCAGPLNLQLLCVSKDPAACCGGGGTHPPSQSTKKCASTTAFSVQFAAHGIWALSCQHDTLGHAKGVPKGANGAHPIPGARAPLDIALAAAMRTASYFWYPMT